MEGCAMQASDYSDVFVSYRRKDVEFTKKLVKALNDAGKEVWIDWEDIPPGSEGFSDDIRRGLEGADAFIAILSPDYLDSTYCVDLELGNAIKMNKKIIPIVLKKFDDYPIPQGIGHINWIYFTPHAGQENTFDESFQKVIDTLEIDLEYNREHKRYLLRALEWDNGDRSGSFLLTGDEIATAESWLMEGASKDPAPTELHTEYIQASRQQATRRQRMLVSGVTVALVVSVILTVLSLVGFYFANANEAEARAQQAIAISAKEEAEAQEAIAVAAKEEADRSAEVSRSLALASAALQPDNKSISVALALEATQIENPPGDAITALMKSAYAAGAQHKIELITSFPLFQHGVSSDLSRVIFNREMFDLMTGEKLLTFVDTPDVSVIAQFLPSDNEVILAGDISFETLEKQESGDTSDLNLITMGVYSTSDGTLIRELSQEAVSELQLSADKMRVIVTHPSSRVKAVYDIATAEEVARIPFVDANIPIISPDLTQYAYIATDDPEQAILYVADVATQTIQHEILIDTIPQNIKNPWLYRYTYTFSPDGTKVTVDNGLGMIAYDIASGEIATEFGEYVTSFNLSGIKSMSYTPNGKHLVVGVVGQSRVNVWETTDGELLHSFRGHSEALEAVIIIDNQYVVSMDTGLEDEGLKHSVVVWDLKDHFLVGTLNNELRYLDHKQNALLMKSPDSTLTWMSLDTFLPLGESFQIPEDVTFYDYNEALDLLVGGHTAEESRSADSFILMSAKNGDIIAEQDTTIAIDDLSLDQLINYTTGELVLPEDVDDLMINELIVEDSKILSDSLVYLYISFEVTDASAEVGTTIYRNMLWDTQSSTFALFLPDDLETSIGHIDTHQNNIYVYTTGWDVEVSDYVNHFIQLDLQTHEEVNRMSLDGNVRAVSLTDDGTQLITFGGESAEKPSTLQFMDITSGEVSDTRVLSSECCANTVAYDPISQRFGNFIFGGGGGSGPMSPSLMFTSGGDNRTAQIIDTTSGNIIWNFDESRQFVDFTADYSRFILADTFSNQQFIYRNDSLPALIEWACANRHVSELDDDLRESYNITSTGTVCDSINTTP